LKIIVYYHDDMDGKCSAAIVKYAYGDGAEIKFVPLLYDDSVELPKDIWTYNRVYILDFTLPKRQMDELCTLFARTDVIWIEHHITALVEHESRYSHFDGIRKNGTAASELTWEWMFGKYSEIPMVVKHISNMDLWQRDDPDTLFFYEWLINYIGGPDNHIWEHLFKSKKVDPDLIWRGEVLRYARMNQMKEDIKKIGYESEIDGHKCFKANYSSFQSISDAGDFICTELGYDLAWIYHARKNNDGNLVRVSSLRSNDNVDASEIAKKYGGGGHKKSAGFVEYF